MAYDILSLVLLLDHYLSLIAATLFCYKMLIYLARGIFESLKL